MSVLFVIAAIALVVGVFVYVVKRPAHADAERKVDVATPQSPSFRRRLRAAIRRAAPDATIARGDEPLSFIVTFPSGTTVTFLYENLKRECEAHPESSDAAIASYVAALVAVGAPKPPALDLENLRATLKDREYVDRANAHPEAPPLLARPFVGDLFIVLTEEHPDTGTRRLLDTNALANLGDLDEDDLFALAMAHVEATFPGMVPTPVEDGSAVSMLVGEQAASWLLAASQWDFMTNEVEGELLASVPCAHVLLFAGSDDASALAKLTSELEAKEQHPVSRALLRWTPKGWTEASA